MWFRRAGGKKRWTISFLGYTTGADYAWPLNKCRWGISTTTSFTTFWGRTYRPTDVFTMHNGKYNGGDKNHTFGCAIFKTNRTYANNGTYIKRVSNIAAFIMGKDHIVRLLARRF